MMINHNSKRHVIGIAHNTDDVVPPCNLYQSPSYFKRIRDFALAQNNSEVLAVADKWQEKLENQKFPSVNDPKQSLILSVIFYIIFYFLLLYYN